MECEMADYCHFSRGAARPFMGGGKCGNALLVLLLCMEWICKSLTLPYHNHLLFHYEHTSLFVSQDDPGPLYSSWDYHLIAVLEYTVSSQNQHLLLGNHEPFSEGCELLRLTSYIQLRILLMHLYGKCLYVIHTIYDLKIIFENTNVLVEGILHRN